jgi:phospholipase C
MKRQLAGLVAVVATTAIAGGFVGAHPARAARIGPTSPIKHVVVIYQENHSFDNVLGAVCQQRTMPCNGYTGSVTFADGVTAQNKVEPDVVPQIVHDAVSQDRGLANKWDKIPGCGLSSNYACVAHFAPSGIPNLAALANQYAVSDASFAAGDAPSFGAHVQLGAGTGDGFEGKNPVASKTGALPGAGWGCNSSKDVPWGLGFQQKLTWEPSCVPLKGGTGAYRATPVPYTESVFEQLELAGLTWHSYEGGSSTHPSKSNWNFCTYFAWCLRNRNNLSYNSSYNSFTVAATKGMLPNVSFLPANGPTSQHNYRSMAQGDNYIGSVVKAVMNGPQWNSTVIFITYDDCGCFYDHVTPPVGLGLRNPMVIVSPWVKPVYTDSTTAVQPYSMLAFIDHNFGLRPLTSQVGNAYDYGNSFDFATPNTETPQMVHTHVSKEEKAKVALYNRLHAPDPT